MYLSFHLIQEEQQQPPPQKTAITKLKRQYANNTMIYIITH